MTARPAAILFDLGGVLLPFDRERRVAAIVARTGAEPDAVQALFAGELPRRMDLGQATLAEFADAFGRLAGRAVTEDDPQALLLSVFEPPNLPLWRLATTLGSRLKVGALSDNPPFVQSMFPAGASLDPLVFSSDIGATKPSEAAFSAAETRLGLPPTDILLIDDAPANVAAARARGWDAILFGANDELMAALALRDLP